MSDKEIKLPKIREDPETGKKYVIFQGKRIWLAKGVTKEDLVKVIKKLKKKKKKKKTKGKAKKKTTKRRTKKAVPRTFQPSISRSIAGEIKDREAKAAGLSSALLLRPPMQQYPPSDNKMTEMLALLTGKEPDKKKKEDLVFIPEINKMIPKDFAMDFKNLFNEKGNKLLMEHHKDLRKGMASLTELNKRKESLEKVAQELSSQNLKLQSLNNDLEMKTSALEEANKAADKARENAEADAADKIKAAKRAKEELDAIKKEHQDIRNKVEIIEKKAADRIREYGDLASKYSSISDRRKDIIKIDEELSELRNAREELLKKHVKTSERVLKRLANRKKETLGSFIDGKIKEYNIDAQGNIKDKLIPVVGKMLEEKEISDVELQEEDKEYRVLQDGIKEKKNQKNKLAKKIATLEKENKELEQQKPLPSPDYFPVAAEKRKEKPIDPEFAIARDIPLPEEESILPEEIMSPDEQTKRVYRNMGLTDKGNRRGEESVEEIIERNKREEAEIEKEMRRDMLNLDRRRLKEIEANGSLSELFAAQIDFQRKYPEYDVLSSPVSSSSEELPNLIDESTSLPAPSPSPSPTSLNNRLQLLKIDDDDDEFLDPSLVNTDLPQGGVGKRKYHRSDKGLNTYQINDIMKGWPDYKGCIASDQIENLSVKPNSRAGFVMNLDPITKEGSHWVAVLVDTRPNGSESVEYYDSLADPPTRRFMSDIRELVSRMEPRDRLMFKTNKIADQSEDTSNCGYFAAKFLIDRFKGKSFAEASGYNARYPVGEKNIELWKESLNIEPFKYLGWTDEEISFAQEGEGIKEVLQDGYRFAKKVGQRIKDVFEGVRKGAPPPVRRWVEKYGTVPISQMKVCRKPIFTIIEKLANWISNGKWEENKKKMSYDRMMHLFVLIKLANGMTIKMEKNQVVQIANAKWDTDSKTESVPVRVSESLTVGSLLDKGEKHIGSAEKFWVYDARTQNCQFFIQWCMKGSGLWTSELAKFVMQDAQGVLKDLGYLGKAAKVVTDIASVGDVILNGKGKKKRKRLLQIDD